MSKKTPFYESKTAHISFKETI